MKKIKILSLLTAVILCLSSCTGVNTSTLSVKSSEIKEYENAGNGYHSSSEYTDIVSETQYLTLSADAENMAVSVCDSTSGTVWSSLPSSDSSSAYAFAVVLYTQSGVYRLNTQDNSVALGAASCDISDGVFTVNYVLSDNEETAKKNYDEITTEDIFVSFSVAYSLSAQTMTVEIDCGSIKCTPNGFVGSITVLPWFGSEESPSDGDYIFVPDGSGAVMNLNYADTDTSDVSVAVYGSDPNCETDSLASGSVPVYGIKKGDGAFAAIITEGDALATINASRQTDNELYKVGADFCITPTAGNDGSSYYYGTTYTGIISVEYKFLSGDSASYIGMASAARESFIESGYLSSLINGDDDSIPFCLTVDGVFEGSVLATATQTQDMLSVLKGKGVNNIILRYKGLLSGGVNQENLYSSRVLNSVGGYDGLETLYEYIQKQNYTLFVDINIFSSYSGYGIFSAAKSLSGSKLYAEIKNELAYDTDENNRLASRITADVASAGKENANQSLYSGEASYSFGLMKTSSISDSFSSFLTKRLTGITDGFLLYDAGSVLYSDKNITRQDAKELIANQARAVSGYGSLAVGSGNIYTLYNAELVAGMMFDTYYPESSAYEPVPFMQAVLHGYVRYTGEPIDAANPLYRFDMLQCIEYGALPSFEWVFDESSIFYYGYYVLSDKVSEIVEFYEEANEMLSGLGGETIVKHEKITQSSGGKELTGIYCTTYSNGTEIYVNYTGSAVTTSGNIVIEPYSCVRIDK
ncbi:MAG: DUF5696 domain-containing protein [Clostridiales bacterium]|nr:DUF5696 domain-containing protein [Clostridiales bacterium]